MPIPGIVASGKLGHLSTNNFTSIQTVTVGSGGASSISFSSIPSTYTHLQVRGSFICSNSGVSLFPRLNGVTSSGNYYWHYLEGNGASASSGAAGTTSILESIFQSVGTVGTYPNAFVMDILDYTSTSKNKVAKTLYGADTNGAGGSVGLGSGVFLTSGTAVSQIDFTLQTGTFSQYSSFALYGVK
jgi:hypothetical protein